jgi:hypothetical protein
MASLAEPSKEGYALKKGCFANDGDELYFNLITSVYKTERPVLSAGSEA